MKIRDLLSTDVDIDITNNVTDDFAAAFVGPLKLTEDGEKEFADVLDYDVVLSDGCAEIIVHRPDDDALNNIIEWRMRWFKASRFFNSAAGYCSEEHFKRWFDTEEDEI